MRRKLYKELGGYQGYCKTPMRVVQECQASIIAEMNVKAEKQAEAEKEQEELEREIKRQRQRL